MSTFKIWIDSQWMAFYSWSEYQIFLQRQVGWYSLNLFFLSSFVPLNWWFSSPALHIRQSLNIFRNKSHVRLLAAGILRKCWWYLNSMLQHLIDQKSFHLPNWLGLNGMYFNKRRKCVHLDLASSSKFDINPCQILFNVVLCERGLPVPFQILVLPSLLQVWNAFNQYSISLGSEWLHSVLISGGSLVLLAAGW